MTVFPVPPEILQLKELRGDPVQTDCMSPVPYRRML